MNPLTALPPTVRKWIYVFYATLGIAFGAVQVGFATAQQDQPLWLLVAFGVFGYLGTALGLVAAANVTSTTSPPAISISSGGIHGAIDVSDVEVGRQLQRSLDAYHRRGGQ